MNIFPQNMSRNMYFKGYDAAPIRTIYHNAKHCNGFLDEMIKAADKEGIDIQMLFGKNKWVQDDRAIVEYNGSTCLIGSSSPVDHMLYSSRIKFNPKRKDGAILVGGNTFMGKFPDGEKWILAGEDSKCADIASISEIYNVKPENIHFIPQQNYHLDMFIRPIGYPYVLVNDPKLVLENIERLDGTDEEKEEFKSMFESYLKYQKMCGYSSCNETINQLEKLGFKPIRIAGDYGCAVNFINSIVNKRKDGTISFITNSTKCDDSLYSSIEKVFEEDLRAKVPNISKVHFISGKDESWTKNRNFIMSTLEYGGGGIHCMSLEEPQFSLWA